MAEVSLGTLYDLNKSAMSQVKPMSKEKLDEAQKEIADWFNWGIDAYAMLLCRERYDFTVFHLYETANVNPPVLAAEEAIGCLTDRGEILSIEKTNDNVAWECWVKIDDEAFVYYLFPYDNAVIEV